MLLSSPALPSSRIPSVAQVRNVVVVPYVGVVLVVEGDGPVA